MNSIFKTAGFLFLIVLLNSCQRDDTTNSIPDARFTYSSIGSFPVTVTFVNLSTTSGGGTSGFIWDFGDGTPLVIATNTVHVYTQPGTYQVKLIQIPSIGVRDTVIKVINLSYPQGPNGSSSRLNNPMTADFNFAITSRAYTASFTNTSGDATSYLWKFGDGITTTTDSVTVVHTYNTSGTYHVNLSATNSNGTDTTGATITFP